MAKWIVCLVFGVLCVIASFGGGGDSTGISCGSDAMSPGDICEETRNGVTETKTYSEMVEDEKSNQQAFDTWGRWALLAAGVVLLGGGTAGIIVRRRKANQPYLGPGYVPGQAEPRQPGQPDAPYMQGMRIEPEPNWYGQQQPGVQPPPPPYQQNQPPGGFGPQGWSGER